MSECEDVDPEDSVPEEDLSHPVDLADALHCAYKKADWYDENVFVSPLEADCASFFRYWSDGNLTVSSDPPTQHRGAETIKRLGLNCQRLKKLRIEAIEGALEGIEYSSGEDRDKPFQGFNKLDATGRLTPFCAAIVSVLREEFGIGHDT